MTDKKTVGLPCAKMKYSQGVKMIGSALVTFSTYFDRECLFLTWPTNYTYVHIDEEIELFCHD